MNRERQDLRLILETRELHDDEYRNEIMKDTEQEWELERMAVNSLREQKHEQLSIIKEQTQAISNMKKKSVRQRNPFYFRLFSKICCFKGLKITKKQNSGVFQ